MVNCLDFIVNEIVGILGKILFCLCKLKFLVSFFICKIKFEGELFLIDKIFVCWVFEFNIVIYKVDDISC